MTTVEAIPPVQAMVGTTVQLAGRPISAAWSHRTYTTTTTTAAAGAGRHGRRQGQHRADQPGQP